MSKHEWLHDLPVRYISPWPRRLLWTTIIALVVIFLVVL